MTQKSLKVVAAAGLVIGGALGIGGTFAPSAALRGLAWGLDGTSLIIAGALLTVFCFKAGEDLAAAGFLVFTVGQGLILSTAVGPMEAGGAAFGTGIGLWSASLAMISAAAIFPTLVRLLGLAAAMLFAIPAVHIFLGAHILPTDMPLPSVGYPVLVATMIGWAWSILRTEKV